MSPLFVILFWLITGALTGAVAGLVLIFFVLPLYFAVRNFRQRGRLFLAAPKLRYYFITVFAGLLIGGAMGVWPFVHSIIYANDFDNNASFYNSYRAPLTFPYELSAINDIGRASIGLWKQDTVVVGNVVRMQQIDDHVLGATYAGAASPLPSQFDSNQLDWFMLDCRRGELRVFGDYETFADTVAYYTNAGRPDLEPVANQFYKPVSSGFGYLLGLSNVSLSLPRSEWKW